MRAAMLDYFRQNEFTRDYTDQELEEFVELLEIKKYRSGKIILREGDKNDSFFFLYKGSAVVLKYDKPSDSSVEINSMSAGSLFGEMSVITMEPVSATIQAKTLCTVLMLSHPKIITHRLYNRFLLACSINVINRLRRLSEKQARLIAQEAERERRRLYKVIDSRNQELTEKSMELQDTKKELTRFYMLKPAVHQISHPGNMIGRSQKMLQVFSLIENVAKTKSTVLITGESGAGKGMVASAIHNLSMRKNKSFVAVNCTVIGDELLASELFGHKRGAFTGASEDRIGRFQTAHRGTIFLDEIGDISPKMQAYFLRIFETGQFERLGDSHTYKVDVRILTATNCDLSKKIKTGAFRQDLFYRLNVVNIDVPPLRERKEDITLLVDHFLEFYAGQFSGKSKSISAETMEMFIYYDWPGNVRELKNAIERAVLLCPDTVITPTFIPHEIRQGESTKFMKEPVHRSFSLSKSQRRSSIDRESIIEALNKSNWNITAAAKILGISRQYLHRMIRKFELKR